MTQVSCTPGYSKTLPSWKNMWSPFQNDFFSFNAFPNSVPAVNIRETPESFFIDLAAPGLRKEDFQVKVEKDILTISAKVEKTEESKDEKWTRKEFSFTSFERSFKLPEVVNSEAIGARYENGLLTLSLPRREEAKMKPVREITVG